MTLTHCQDHILAENIWFIWFETSYSRDERRCYRTLKIELLSQRKHLNLLSGARPVPGCCRGWSSGGCYDGNKGDDNEALRNDNDCIIIAGYADQMKMTSDNNSKGGVHRRSLWGGRTARPRNSRPRQVSNSIHTGVTMQIMMINLFVSPFVWTIMNLRFCCSGQRSRLIWTSRRSQRKNTLNNLFPIEL